MTKSEAIRALQEKAEKEIDQAEMEALHERGFLIAQRHLTPYLHELEKKHGFKKAEIGAALIILAYAAFGGKKKDPGVGMKVFVQMHALLRLTVHMIHSPRPPLH